MDIHKIHGEQIHTIVTHSHTHDSTVTQIHIDEHYATMHQGLTI